MEAQVKGKNQRRGSVRKALFSTRRETHTAMPVSPQAAREQKQKFMKGNGDFLSHIESLEGNHSSYQGTFRGVSAAHPIPKTEIERLSSCSIAGVVPDPQTMGGNRLRLSSYTRDLRSLTDAFKSRGFKTHSGAETATHALTGMTRVHFP